MGSETTGEDDYHVSFLNADLVVYFCVSIEER